MSDTIKIEECITRLDAIRHEIVSNSRDHLHYLPELPEKGVIQ